MEERSDSDQWTEPVGPEVDDTVNPTEAAPDSGSEEDAGGRPKTQAGREMLVQLQQMIDTLATQASPVMREVAAKSAELAAIAAEKAGPLAYKAADVTKSVSERVAARSKEMAADLRRPQPSDEASEDSDVDDDARSPDTADWPADPPTQAND
jgi:hypothetical protein